jgi:hypothetical protein
MCKALGSIPALKEEKKNQMGVTSTKQAKQLSGGHITVSHF